MEGFSGRDKYRGKREEPSPRENRPLRYIPPYEGLTDQSTSSAQRPSNYGEESVAGSMYNWLFGQADTLGRGSYEDEGGYRGDNSAPIYDRYPDDSDSNMPSSSSRDSAANSSGVTQRKRDEQEDLFSANQSESKTVKAKNVGNRADNISGRQFGTREHGRYSNEGRSIDRNQEHIYDPDQLKIEIAKTKKYLERWKNKEDNIYQLARDVLQNLNMDQNGLLETLSQINENLEKLLFKQEKETAKEPIRWVEIFRNRFDIQENWVRAGIEQQLEQLEMKLEDFRESFQQLQKLIKDSSPASYEELVKANTKCEFICGSLKHGIPVERIPDRICGRKVTYVSDKGNNCLIRAWLRGAYPKYEDRVIEAGIKDIRELLEMNGVVEKGAMLGLGENEVEREHLIDWMKTTNWIEADRGLLLYLYSNDKIQCLSITDGTSDKLPYAVLLNLNNKHFYAIEVPEEASSSQSMS
jgi:hypothetical protein